MSLLRTLNSSCPCFTSSPSRASISTTLPEASEGTGTCRETSGLTTPVTFNSGAARYSPAVTSGNCSGWSTLRLLASMSGSTVAGCGPVRVPPGPARAFRMPPWIELRTDRSQLQKQKHDSWNHLPAHRHVHLGRRGQIRANQIQIGQTRVAIGLLRIQIIQQRSAAVSVRESDFVARVFGQFQVFVPIGRNRFRALTSVK